MAINPGVSYPGRVTAPSGNYPYASSKNETSPGAGDGTPYELARADDVFGMQQALLTAAGITPSGNADTALASEYMQAIIELASGRANSYDESGVADAYVLDVRANQQAPASLFDGLIALFTVGNTNTGASTVNVAGLGVKTILSSAGSALAAGQLVAGQKVKLEYDGTDFILHLAENIPATITRAINGYIILPGGLIIQWGASATTVNPETVNFPIAFPNAVFRVFLTPTYVALPAVGGYTSVFTTSLTGYVAYKDTAIFGNHFLAIGY